MANRILKWLGHQSLKSKAQALGAPAITTMEGEMQACRERLRSGPEFLRRQLEVQVGMLRKACQRITDASTEYSLEKGGIERLQTMVDRGVLIVGESQSLRRGHDNIKKKIEKADAERNHMNSAVQSLPRGALRENGDALKTITRLCRQLEGEHRQQKFYDTLRQLEREVQQHSLWLESMKSNAMQLAEIQSELKSLRTSITAMISGVAAENMERAEQQIILARRAWEQGNTGIAGNQIKDAALCLKTARNACDRTLTQAHDELAMWRQFIQTARSYTGMKAMICSFSTELPESDLQRWIDYRQESEKEISVSAALVAQTLRELPFRAAPVLPWHESDTGALCEFAQTVNTKCREMISLLEKRHQKRRRRDK